MKKKKSKGQLLILVLGVMGMGMLVIAPLLAYVDLSLRLSLKTTLRTSAYYAAEAGIQWVIGDIYQAQSILEKSNNSSYSGIMNGYNFSVNVSPYSGAAAVVQGGGSAYFDPGVTMYMRPMMAYPNPNCSSSYPFVAVKGKDVKINWAGYVSAPGATNKSAYDNSTQIEKLNTTISLWKVNENGSEVLVAYAYKTPTPDEVYASDHARVVANTLYVPGANISGGTYKAKFNNTALVGATYWQACSMTSAPDMDAEYYTLNGTIQKATRNCSDFFDSTLSGNVTIMVINSDNGDTAGKINTFSFFCDYVALNITSNISGNLTTNSYTCNVTAGGGGNRSYTGMLRVGSGIELGDPGSASYHLPAVYGGNYYPWKNQDNHAKNVIDRIPPPAGGAGFTIPNASFSELSAANYSAISSADGIRKLATYDPRNVSMNNSCMWYVFNVPEGRSALNLSNVVQIDVHWEGYQTKSAACWSWSWWFLELGCVETTDNDSLSMMMWNYYEDTNKDGLNGKYHLLDRKINDAGLTWVKLVQGGYMDYLITSTSSKGGEPAVTITSYVRQVPGPALWSEPQSLDILSWNVHIY